MNISRAYSRIGRKCWSVLQGQSSQTHDRPKGEWKGKVCVTPEDVAGNSGGNFCSKALRTQVSSSP